MCIVKKHSESIIKSEIISAMNKLGLNYKNFEMVELFFKDFSSNEFKNYCLYVEDATMTLKKTSNGNFRVVIKSE